MLVNTTNAYDIIKNFIYSNTNKYAVYKDLEIKFKTYTTSYSKDVYNTIQVYDNKMFFRIIQKQDMETLYDVTLTEFINQLINENTLETVITEFEKEILKCQ